MSSHVVSSRSSHRAMGNVHFTITDNHAVQGAGPEEFVNLPGLLVQSLKRFGISSVQFSSQVTSLPGKFVQFSSWHGGQVPTFSPFSSGHSVHSTNSSGPDSD